LAFAHLQAVGLGEFYQSEFSPALIWVCSGTFASLPIAINRNLNRKVDPHSAPGLAAATDFLERKTQSFDCKDLALSPADQTPIDDFQHETLYLIAFVAGIWKISGISWGALVPLAALFAAAMSATLYGVCRLFLRPPYAAAATILAILSPWDAMMMPELRDYSKAPFILGVIFSCGWLVKSVERPKQFVAAAALAGILAGIGVGVRTDLAMALPFFALVLVLAAVCSGFRIYRIAFLGGVVFALAFVCAALPVLSAYRGGGNVGHVSLLGLTTPFDKPLGVSASLYDVADQYRDEAIYQFTEEFAIGRQGQSGSRPALGWYGSREYSRYSLQALFAYALHFPADMLVRGYSAALQTIALRFGEEAPVPIPRWLAALRSALIVPAGALPLLFMFAALIAWSNIRLAAFLILVFMYFAGLGALQFHFRHVFYLEFFYWLSLVGVIAGSVEALRYGVNRQGFSSPLRIAAPRAIAAFAVPSVALGTAVFLLVALRSFQNPHAHQLVDQYLTAPREPVQLVEEQAGDEILLRPTGEAPGMSGANDLIEQTPFEGYYFDATIDTERCPEFAATISYKKYPFIDISRDILLESGGKPGNGHIIFPIMNSNRPPQTKFEGVKISAEQRPCFLGLQAIADYKSLPLPLWLQLPPEWRDERLYQTQTRPLLSFGRETSLITNLRSEAIPGFEAVKPTIQPFGEKAWERLYEPATAEGAGIRISGAPPSPYYYAASSVLYKLPKHTIVAARGRVKRGGAMLGVLNVGGTRWVATLSLPVGDFVALLVIPETDEYRVTVANNLSGSEIYNDVEISDIGVIGRDPSELRVR
jgi:hypothetical protein